jgi:hypothetical protein
MRVTEEKTQTMKFQRTFLQEIDQGMQADLEKVFCLLNPLTLPGKSWVRYRRSPPVLQELT